MAREEMVFTFPEAAKTGGYQDRPVLQEDLDLLLLLSRNDKPQPFYLICEHDTVLITMSGTGAVLFKDSAVVQQDYETGDFIYVPAGIPHRIVPNEESVQYRYKLAESELEAAAWFCEACGTEIYRDTWTLGEASWEDVERACAEFNADELARNCTSCNSIHAKIDMAALRSGNEQYKV